MFQDLNRQTGRTERMLQEAERLLADGKHVVIYCLPAQMIPFGERLSHHDNLSLRSRYFSPYKPQVNRDLKFVELFDTAFISRHYGVWLDEFHRYDRAAS